MRRGIFRHAPRLVLGSVNLARHPWWMLPDRNTGSALSPAGHVAVDKHGRLKGGSHIRLRPLPGVRLPVFRSQAPWCVQLGIAERLAADPVAWLSQPTGPMCPLQVNPVLSAHCSAPAWPACVPDRWPSVCRIVHWPRPPSLHLSRVGACVQHPASAGASEPSVQTLFEWSNPPRRFRSGSQSSAWRLGCANHGF